MAVLLLCWPWLLVAMAVLCSPLSGADQLPQIAESDLDGVSATTVRAIADIVETIITTTTTKSHINTSSSTLKDSCSDAKGKRFATVVVSLCGEVNAVDAINSLRLVEHPSKVQGERCDLMSRNLNNSTKTMSNNSSFHAGIAGARIVCGSDLWPFRTGNNGGSDLNNADVNVRREPAFGPSDAHPASVLATVFHRRRLGLCAGNPTNEDHHHGQHQQQGNILLTVALTLGLTDKDDTERLEDEGNGGLRPPNSLMLQRLSHQLQHNQCQLEFLEPHRQVNNSICLTMLTVS